MSFVWLPHAVTGSEEDGCYNVAVIELDGTAGDPVRMLSNVVDAWAPGDLEVGERVQVECIRLSETVGVPCFRREMAKR
jgi:uncharacterized OB-fold protein